MDNGPGRKWLEGFMKRHQNLSIRTPKYLHNCRAYMSESSIRKWFKEVCT